MVALPEEVEISMAKGPVVSNEKRAPGCLGCIGGEKLPFGIGFIVSHYRNPY